MANVYCFDQHGGVDIPEPHDPGAVLDYTFLYKPETWAVGKQYSRGNIVLPTLFSGFLMECIDSGVSGALEPLWPADLGESIADNTVEWRSREYNFYLEFNEKIAPNLVTGGYLSTFSATNGVVVGNSVSNDRASKIWVLTVPPGVREFSITNRFTTDYERTDERTINVRVKER